MILKGQNQNDAATASVSIRDCLRGGRGEDARERQQQCGQLQDQPHCLIIVGGEEGLAGGGAGEYRPVPQEGLLLAEDLTHAANLSTDAAQLFFNVLIAAIDVVDAIEDAFTVGNQRGENEGRRWRAGRSTSRRRTAASIHRERSRNGR